MREKKIMRDEERKWGEEEISCPEKYAERKT